MNPTTTVKLTAISQSAMAIIEDSITIGMEAGDPCCATAKTTKSTVSGSRDFFDRLAQDFETAATDAPSVAETTNKDLADGFVQAADKRLTKALRAWSAKCDDLSTPDGPTLIGRPKRKAKKATPKKVARRGDYGKDYIIATCREDEGGRRELRVGQGVGFKSDMECYGTIVRFEECSWSRQFRVVVKGDFASTNYGSNSAELLPEDLFDIEG